MEWKRNVSSENAGLVACCMNEYTWLPVGTLQSYMWVGSGVSVRDADVY